MRRFLRPLLESLCPRRLAAGLLLLTALGTGGPAGADTLPILVYHQIRVAEDGPPDGETVLSLEHFEAQMRHLDAEGYRSLGMDEVTAFLRGQSFPQKVVAIHFDDGWKSSQAVLALRRRHPRWGPRKLRVVLQRKQPRVVLPAPSAIGDILKRNDRVRPRRRIRRSSPYGDRLRQYDAPNAVWCADFKGHFPIGGRRDQRCHPLTISDGFSRYLLRCRALRRPLHRCAQRVFESAFGEFGLPRAIRTDNGPPFSTLAPGGLSRLAVWWIRLGIRPERM